MSSWVLWKFLLHVFLKLNSVHWKRNRILRLYIHCYIKKSMNYVWCIAKSSSSSSSSSFNPTPLFKHYRHHHNSKTSTTKNNLHSEHRNNTNIRAGHCLKPSMELLVCLCLYLLQFWFVSVFFCFEHFFFFIFSTFVHINLEGSLTYTDRWYNLINTLRFICYNACTLW